MDHSPCYIFILFYEMLVFLNIFYSFDVARAQSLKGKSNVPAARRSAGSSPVDKADKSKPAARRSGFFFTMHVQASYSD